MTAVDRLCACLGQETHVCDDLAAVLRAEQAAVTRLRAEDLFACLERGEGLRQDLVRLAGERRALVQALAGTYGSDVRGAVALLPLLPAGPRARVRAALRRLRTALLALRGLERQTALLVRGSADAVHELLRALAALVPGARYGADAAIALPAAIERVARTA